MARAYCPQCSRPLSHCICGFMVKTDNQVEVILLQHPKEVGHPKGTANLLLGSLTNVKRFVGECFDEHDAFQQYMTQLKSNASSSPCLLYPSEGALQLDSSMFKGENRDITAQSKLGPLIVIDSTWKKSYKTFQLSKCLQSLTQVSLPNDLEGQYEIRTTRKQNALSTLEAVSYALQFLEQDQEKYDTLLKSFVKFNQYQLSFRQNHQQ
ncbi:MAG: DTW domain-containing protein [Thalassotalea sp.]|nr:DTW domain-containing protein [Thalassotalea sp.]